MESDQLPRQLRHLILSVAARKDVHSVSCPFHDRALWEGLLAEQARRVRITGQAPASAFFLSGPDSGLPGIAKLHPGLEDDDRPLHERFTGDTLEERIGGSIHIPFEGVCGADLFVYPDWRRIYPELWAKPGAEMDWATIGKPCNLLLIERDLGEPDCATRSGPFAGGWWLYSSKGPYKDCHPGRQPHDPDILRKRPWRLAELRAYDEAYYASLPPPEPRQRPPADEDDPGSLELLELDPDAPNEEY